MTPSALDRFAPHVRAAIAFELGRGRPSGGEANATASLGHRGPGSWVSYPDRKTGGAPPPPPRWPVYQLFYDDRGERCRLFELDSGRMRNAGTLYAGFVRVSRRGGIYLSQRPGVGLQGDSHPTIASRSPEWLAGERTIVAGGEVGIIEGRIVGHNDKTGHFLTRRNREQSGLPSDLFQPFTVDPKVWYKGQ